MAEDKPERPFDPNKLAVALQYDRARDPAPKVTAKGKGHMAEQIIAIAKAHNVEIKEDKDLVNILPMLEIDALIPFDAYTAVAEILAYVYRANDKAGKRA